MPLGLEAPAAAAEVLVVLEMLVYSKIIFMIMLQQVLAVMQAQDQ